MNTLIIGPSSSGKTTMLSVLQIASGFYPSLYVEHKNKTFADLFIQGPRVLLSGARVPATATVTEYKFRIVPRGFTSIMQRSLHYSLLDGPGGTLFPSATLDIQAAIDAWRTDPNHETLLRHARKATSLMLCVDSTNYTNAALFATFLPLFLDQINQTRFFRMKRVLVMLTKAEALVDQHGHNAYLELDALDIRTQAQRVLSIPGLNALRRVVRNPFGKAALCWGSAYGFLSSGAANYSGGVDAGPLLTSQNYPGLSEGDILNWWNPLSLISPLIFLSGGRPSRDIHVIS